MEFFLLAGALRMKFNLLLYSNILTLRLAAYSTKQADSIIRFCCDSVFFISSVCTSLRPDLFFFPNEPLFIAAISNVAPRYFA